jgi:hypothetical protein
MKLTEVVLHLKDVNGIEEVALPVIEVAENNVLWYCIDTPGYLDE